MEKEIRSFIKRLIKATKQREIKWEQRKTLVQGPYASHVTREAESFFENNTVILEKTKEWVSGISGARYTLNIPKKNIFELEIKDFYYLFSKPLLLQLIEIIGLDEEIPFPYHKNISRSSERRVVIMATKPFPDQD